jgi:hypothetical protein
MNAGMLVSNVSKNPLYILGILPPDDQSFGGNQVKPPCRNAWNKTSYSYSESSYIIRAYQSILESQSISASYSIQYPHVSHVFPRNFEGPIFDAARS